MSQPAQTTPAPKPTQTLGQRMKAIEAENRELRAQAGKTAGTKPPVAAPAASSATPPVPVISDDQAAAQLSADELGKIYAERSDPAEKAQVYEWLQAARKREGQAKR